MIYITKEKIALIKHGDAANLKLSAAGRLNSKPLLETEKFFVEKR